MRAFWFIYITVHSSNLLLSSAHSPTFLSLHLCHNSFSNPSVTLPTVCHSSFFNPSVASPISQFILQPFRCFSYITSSPLNSPGESPMGEMNYNKFHNAPKLSVCVNTSWARSSHHLVEKYVKRIVCHLLILVILQHFKNWKSRQSGHLLKFGGQISTSLKLTYFIFVGVSVFVLLTIINHCNSFF